MQSTPAPKPEAQQTWHATLGGACLGAGITFAICRYTLLPLQLGGNLSAILIGLAAGLAVTGASLLRSADQRNWGAVGLALLAGVGIAFGASWFLFPRPTPLGEEQLQKVTLPGVNIQLPTSEPSSRKVSPAAGRIRYDYPWNRPGTIAIEWEPGQTLTLKEAEYAWGSLRDQIDPKAELKLEALSGRSIAGHRFAILAEKMVLTGVMFQCPDDPRNFSLVTGFPVDPATARILVDRVLDTVVCTQAPPLDQTAPLMPAFDLPGYGLVAGSRPAQLQNLDGEALLIHTNAHGDMQQKLRKSPQVFEALFRSMFAAEEGKSSFHPPRELELPDELPRQWWPIDATMDGERLAMGFSALDCPGQTSFLLFSMRPADGPLGPREEKVLSAIRCPSKISPAATPPDFVEMTAKACEGKDVRGCSLLATHLSDTQPDDPRIEDLFKQACELGDKDACQAPGVEKESP